MVEPVGLVAMPALVKLAFVRPHGPQPDLSKTERTAHQFLDGAVDGGMADQIVEGRRGDEGIVIGLLVVAVGMPEIRVLAAVLVEEI